MPVLLGIIALFVIGGGVYVYENKKAEMPVVVDTGIEQADQVQEQTNTKTPPVNNTQTNNASSQTDTSNWKIYNNPKNFYSIKYPPEWNLETYGLHKDDEVSFKDKNGKVLVSDNVSLGDINQDLEDFVINHSGSYMELIKKEKISMKKIIDDAKTLGYISEWKIFIPNKTVIEIRADFESKTAKPLVSPYGTHKKVVSFLTASDWGTDLNLFNQMVTTFKFTQ